MIFIEDERIKLNGVVLPGLIKSIEVTETAKVDEQEVEGSATKPKQATGYEDAKVPIVSEDTAAHGIEKVIFKKLTHKGENKKSQLTASLELWEYIPQTITATSSSGGSGGSSASSKAKAATAAASNLNPDYQQYLGTKRGKSPASDMVTGAATAALNKVMSQMPY
ncbi:MAG: transcriptional regulator [Oscillospiraceae bacterium]|nr:transcriptional regulator [Oscillospiraceae bacterium]